MTFKDIIEKGFSEGYATTQIGTNEIIVALLLTSIISIYIFYCYRIITRKTFYSKNFNISLICVALVTAGIILTIQSSFVISLGMVGALSIVRFRTAIKDPMDLVFMFWSISVGIICGAGLAEIAVILSMIITICLLVFDKLPISKSPMILVVNAVFNNETDDFIDKTITSYCKYHIEKSRSISNGMLDVVVELRIQNGNELVKNLSSNKNINSISLLRHDGEVTF